MLSAKQQVRVLDFAGGNGITYYRLKPYLLHSSNVIWEVCDSSNMGLEMGRNFSLKDEGIQFIERLPDKETRRYDVIHINTSLQYFPDYRTILNELFSFQPTYFILTRLLAGEISSYVTSQGVNGKRTPCRIINILEFCEFLKSNGYDLIFKSATEEHIKNFFNEEVPENLKIPFSLALVFMKNKTT